MLQLSIACMYSQSLLKLNGVVSGPYGVRIDNLLSISRSYVGGGSVPRSESPDGADSYRTAPRGPLFRAQARKSVGPYRVRIDNLLSMFLRPDFECLQQLANLILDRLIMRAIVASRTAPQGPLFRRRPGKA